MITVSTCDKKYTINIFDHLLVTVKVELSHAHSANIYLELSCCVPITKVSGNVQRLQKHEITKQLVEVSCENI